MTYSYLCVGCNQGIKYNGFKGQQVVLKHIRHGEVIESIQGEYDGYGQVINDSWDSLKEVQRSLWCFEDSIDYNKKVYLGQLMNWIDFRILKAKERGINMVPGDKEWKSGDDLTQELKNEWKNMPIIPVEHPRSGIEAWHLSCYESSSKEQLDSHTISKVDPYLAMGDL